MLRKGEPILLQKLVAMAGSKKAHRQEQMFKLVAACYESGLTKKAFCQQEGLHPQVFYYWQRKYRQANSTTHVSNGTCLMPLELKETPKSVNPALEIHYPNG